MIRWIHNAIYTLLGRNRSREIAFDEVFLDSHNLPAFDRHQFEGRLEYPIGKRTLAAIGVIFALLGLAYLIRLGGLQVLAGDRFATISAENRLRHAILFADRGVVEDRTGTPLIWNVPGEEDFAPRRYASERGLAHVLGYVSYPAADASGIYYQDTFIGRAGIEAAWDERLGGENGIQIVEIDAHGDLRSESTIEPPRDGETLALSIDAALQQALYENIERTAAQEGYTGGAGVIIDVMSGEVLALTSFPAYDPNVLAEGAEEKQIAAYVNDPAKPFLNRAIAGLYTPGSIVKPFVAAAALAEDIIPPDQSVLSTGSLLIPNPYDPDHPTAFNDWKIHGWVDMREAIAVSSNVYFFIVGGGLSAEAAEGTQNEARVGLGIDRINTYLHRFGLAERTGIDIPGEQIGTIPNPSWKEEVFDESWRIGDTYNTAIGQYGFQITPLQAALGVAAIANGGDRVMPVLERGAHGARTPIGTDPNDMRIVREGMRRAVLTGTAQGLSNPYVRIAAKTGTAEIGTRKEYINSWAVGFFPYEAPRYAFAVLMERGPSRTHIGGVFAMRGLLEWMQQNADHYFAADTVDR